MIFNPPDSIKALTPQNPFGRLEDGRPDVPDDILKRVRLVTAEEAWHILSRKNGYKNQFSGMWPVHMHPQNTLVGRAVTAVFVPIRPDLDAAINAIARAEGRAGRHNQWIIETLRPGDVLVVDIFGKIADGTMVGDNLSTRVRARTRTGMVLNCAFRDLHGLERLADFPVYSMGIDPSALNEVALVGVNVPVNIRGATVLPGDVVLGTRAGVTFIPPHIVHEVLEYSEGERERDVWSKQQLELGTYTSAQLDVVTWEPDVEAAYQTWRRQQAPR